jgi:hypothetical protein
MAPKKPVAVSDGDESLDLFDDDDDIDPACIRSTDNDEFDAMCEGFVDDDGKPDVDAWQAWHYENDEDEPESARKRQPRKAHPAPSVAMLMEAEKLAAQAKKAYEKVKRQKAKEALKNELNVAERKRRPRKAHPAPSVAMLKEAEKLSKQASKLHEKAKKQEAKEAVAAAAADAKETAAYVAQLEKELVKARAAVKKKIRQLNAAEGCLR